MAEPRLSCLHHDPPIFSVDGFLSPAECEELIALFNTGTGTEAGTKALSSKGTRTSTTRYLDFSKCRALLQGAERLLGLLPGHCSFEEPQVVRYTAGQSFSSHLDSIQPQLQDGSGNRVATLIVYLNSLRPGEGGETCFSYLDLCVTPSRGKALIFFPSFSSGLVDDRMLHCAMPPELGREKHIAQVWARQRQYLPAMRQELMQRQRAEEGARESGFGGLGC